MFVIFTHFVARQLLHVWHEIQRNKCWATKVACMSWPLAAYGAVCTNGKIMADNLNFSMALPTSVIFWDINFVSKTWFRTWVSVSVPNVVRICSQMAELPPINWFQNGSFRHLGFFAYANFDGKCDSGARSIKFGVNMCNNGLHLELMHLLTSDSFVVLPNASRAHCWTPVELW